MATTRQHLTARADTDLMQRAIAAAEQAGVINAQQAVEGAFGRIISQPVDGSQTIADVHAYADAVRREAVAALPPLPGANLAAVTDAHITTALTAAGIIAP